ncbi:hypothetical protein D5S17_33410 [Pseudonocardiaceae bacterium YIM PH 21723]|nr:hypothetical protein D5S17_33410 [Pseudonocardiaceae bacterium YIM PH 21723]
MWLWLALCAAGLPAAVTRWTSMAGAFLGGPGGGLAGWTVRLLAVVESLPALMLPAALGTLLLPWLRARRVHRRHAPVEVPEQILEFTRRYAPGVAVRGHALPAGRLAAVYPLGWRRPVIAVSPALVRLWHTDRAAARIVLAHQLAHCRSGDHLLLGLASPFVLSSRLAPVLVPALGLPGLALLAASRTVPGDLVVVHAGLLLAALAQLLLPVAALWSAELAADRFAVETQGSAGMLTLSPSRSSPLGITRPPVRLRRRLATVWASPAGTAAMLAGWPLVYLLLLPLAVAIGVIGRLLLGDEVRGVWSVAAHYLVMSWPMWLAALVLIGGWPLLAHTWTRLWTGQRTGALGTPARAYWTAAALPGLCLLLSLTL